MKHIIILTIFFLFPELLFGQQAVTLDFSFDTDGLVVTSVGTVEDRAFAVAVQTDGKIVIAGVSAILNDRQSLVSRYHADGSIDSTFGVNGHQILNLQPGVDDNFNSILIQPDGKILLSGPTGSGNAFMTNVVRLHSDGSFDSGFGINGIKTFSLASGYSYPPAMLQDSFGRTVIVGHEITNMFLLRILPDGTPDSTFNGDGISSPVIPGIFALAFGMAFDNEGRILAVGYSGGASEYMIARFDSTGTLDTTFGLGGLTLVPITGFGGLLDCKVQPDGKIVACGSFDASGVGNNHDFVILRLNDDGSLDSTFSNDGIFEKPVSNDRDILQSILLQPDGKILAAGYAQNGAATGNFAMIRLNIDGSLDNTFGSNGLVLTDFNSSLDIGSKVVLQPDLKAVLCGWTFQNNKWNVALARYGTGLNVGTQEYITNDNKLSIFPNPVHDILNVEYSTTMKGFTILHIFNCYGQEVGIINKDDRTGGFQSFKVDVRIFPTGVYFLSLEGNCFHTSKFIKD